MVTQVHGAEIAEVQPHDRLDDVRGRQADGLVTRQSGIAVGVRTADCLPLLLAHPASGTVSVVHAGWRGAVAGVVQEALNSIGVPASELVCAIGPHIRVDAFEIGNEVADAMVAAADGATDVIDRTRSKPHGDLSRLVTHLLTRAGVNPNHIDDVGGCTYSEPARFVSYRRDHKTKARQVSAILAAQPAAC